VDSIRKVELLETAAKDVPNKTLDTVLGPGYGIFAGEKLEGARLPFSPERARWAERTVDPADETGAGMIGQVEFNSATFYRYAVVDAGNAVHRPGGCLGLC
jgi:hypothetical protein